MLWPTVTELPRHLEPTGDDTFVRDLDERTEPGRPPTRAARLATRPPYARPSNGSSAAGPRP